MAIEFKAPLSESEEERKSLTRRHEGTKKKKELVKALKRYLH